MRRTKWNLALCVIVGGIALGAGPDEPATQQSPKEQHIRQLMEMSGSGKLGVQVAGQLLDQFRKTYPKVPAEFWDQAKAEMTPDSLIDLIVPIYEKHFTDDDILELIKFYKTPIGQKLVKELPQITAESMPAGERWGRAMAQRILNRMQEKGYLQT